MFANKVLRTKMQCLKMSLLLHINLIEAHRDILISSAFITADPQFNVITARRR